MDKYEVKSLINKQAFMELFANRASIEMKKESAEILDIAIDEIEDGWTEVFDKIYECYPSLVKGRVEVADVIFNLTGLFDREDIKDFDAEQFGILAGVIADTAITFFEGYERTMEYKRSRAWVKDKLGLE